MTRSRNTDLVILAVHHLNHVNLPVFTRNMYNVTDPSFNTSDGVTVSFHKNLRLSWENLGQSHMTWMPVSSSNPYVHPDGFESPIFVRPQCTVIAPTTTLLKRFRSMHISSLDHNLILFAYSFSHWKEAPVQPLKISDQFQSTKQCSDW